METTDPYEQQLLAVFESCDDYCQNSLSSAGLYQLCEKLQLEDHYHKLLTCVLGESYDRRVSFNEFKDGLLKLLNNSECEGKCDRDSPPAQEVPSKCVNERKKYGRSSRRDNIDNENTLVDDGIAIHHDNQLGNTESDSGSEETLPKKRKTRFNRPKDGEKLSYDAEAEIPEAVVQPISCTVNEEECLSTAWSTVSRGVKNSLNKDELVNVFQCVGLESGSEEAAQKVFEKLELEETDSITLQKLLDLIRSGVCWSRDMRGQELESEVCQKNTSFDYLEPSALGCVTGACIVEKWESAGVPEASHLLHKLGLDESQQVDLSSLIALLLDEFKILSDDKSSRYLDNSSMGLLSVSVLQNLHVQNLKSLIEHMNAEKEKLRNDVIEANQRALLLAQEIDEHHSKLELSTQQQVKVLEQKHAEKIRELAQQLKLEQDSNASHISALEAKVLALEEERNKCKAVIVQVMHENKTLEQEHRAVMDQLTELQNIKKKLEKDLTDLSSLQQKATEMEATVNNNEILSLMERIHLLESENINLKDRNDELSMEVEELSAKLSNAFIKKRSSPVNSLAVGVNESMEESNFGGGGTKRRGESFIFIESAEDSGGDEGSPRLGKVRKCSPAMDYLATTNSLEGLQIDVAARGESVDDDIPDKDPTLSAAEEVRFNGTRTRRNISFSQELQQIADDLKEPVALNEKMKLLEEKFIRLDSCQSKDLMNHVKELLNAAQRKTSECEGCLEKEEKLRVNEEESKKIRVDFEKQTQSLGERCEHLEASLELLKEEYEKTEDYWSGKLEDERTFFEEEQKLSDKKYAELIDKIIEYEEMLRSEGDSRQRLETIDEKDGFEKQVMDLEEECYELRSKFAEAVKEKDNEIELLKRKINTFKEPSRVIDASVQTAELSVHSLDEVDSLTKGIYENVKKSKVSELKSSTFPPEDRKAQNCSCHAIQTSRSGGSELKNLQDTKSQLEREIEILTGERDLIYREITGKRRETNSRYSTSDDSVSSKFNEMEEKCHSLMATLRHQQKQTEEILKSTWKQHKLEVKDLKSVLKLTEDKLKRQTEVIQEQLSKLARTDLLVKDLFVENAYLVSSVQKLEQQCQPPKSENVTV